MPIYNCSICGTCPDEQKSHHTKHLKTKKHKIEKRVLELELEKMTDKERMEKHGKTDIAAIVASAETVVSENTKVHTIAKKKVSGEVTWNVGDNKDSNENYAQIKVGLQSLVKVCHQVLYSRCSIVGIKAQNDIMRILCIKILQNQFNDQNSELWSRCYEVKAEKNMSDKQFQRFKNYCNCLSDITKTDNIEKEWRVFVTKFLIPLFPSIYYDDDTKFNCQDSAVITELILKLDVIKVTDEFSDAFATSCGDIHELFRAYCGGKAAKELGQYFTPRNLIHLIFYGIGLDVLLKDKKNITVYDPCMGTGGFLTRLFNLCKIDSSNVYGCETEMDTIKFGEMSMVLTTGNTNTNIVKCDSLCENQFIQDTKVDCIVTNPPFGTSMKYDDLKTKFEKTFPNSVVAFADIYPLKTNNGACLFVQHCVYMLREGGVCAVVLPDGELFEGNSQWSKKFRKWLCESVNIRTILKAPSGVFQHTGVKTNVVIFTKDGPTQSIRFLETNKECNEVRDMFSVHMDELLATKFSLDVGEYIEDVSENYDVPMVALGDVCDINGGTRIVKKECSSGIYPVYGSGEPTFNTNNSNRSGKNIIVGRFALSEKCVRIIEGDIYLNDSGLSIHNDNPVTFQYIGYYLLFNQSVIYNLSRGQAQRNLNMNKFKELKIPLPSLEVQQQIVDELTLVEDSTTTIQTRLDQLKREKEQYRKYGKKAEIRTLLEGSESNMLGDVCEFQTYKPLRKKDFIDGKYMVIGGGKKHSGYHNNYNREENTILCSGTGSYAGYISRYNTKVWASEAFSIHSVDLNILNEDYLFLFLVSIQDKLYKSRPASGGQPHMYPKTLQSKIKIPLPSLEIQEQCITIFEQKEAYIESIDKKIAEHKNYLEELKTLAKDVITSFC
jgi:type I restriction-modification system DNA methylase subunit/restriction endonuclease S subunit